MFSILQFSFCVATPFLPLSSTGLPILQVEVFPSSLLVSFMFAILISVFFYKNCALHSVTLSTTCCFTITVLLIQFFTYYYLKQVFTCILVSWTYSVNCSRTHIYPGSIQLHLATNTKPKHNLVSYQCLHRHKHVIDQGQTNGQDQLSMSLHWHKHLINQRQTNGHDQLSMSLHRHKHLIDQCQTNGHDQLSMSLQRHKHLINQCQTKRHDQLSMSLQGHKYWRSKPN